jgi:hypothetical protein
MPSDKPNKLKRMPREAPRVPTPVTEPKPGNKAKAPRPVKKLDRLDVERADSEGMAQPQAMQPKQKASRSAPKVKSAKKRK